MKPNEFIPFMAISTLSLCLSCCGAPQHGRAISSGLASASQESAFAATSQSPLEVSLTTDKDVYSSGAQGISEVTNDASFTIFLPGCSAFQRQQYDGTKWVDVTPEHLCIVEGTAIAIPSRGRARFSFLAKNPGIFRLNYQIAWGCLQGMPLSQASCSSHAFVHTPVFAVSFASGEVPLYTPQHVPECQHLGSKSEGWYWADTKARIAFASCAALGESRCKFVGTRSEGWYSDAGLIAWDNCHLMQTTK